MTMEGEVARASLTMMAAYVDSATVRVVALRSSRRAEARGPQNPLGAPAAQRSMRTTSATKFSARGQAAGHKPLLRC